MNSQTRVEVASMHIFFRPFTVMEILVAVNKSEPRLQVIQVLQSLRRMTAHGKLIQRALGKYEWVK